MNVVMLVRNRPRLTQQAIDSLYAHTDIPFNLTVVDDGSDNFHTRRYLSDTARTRDNFSLLTVANSQHVTAKLRNLGVYWSEKTFGRGEWLYLSDNDAYFTDGWAGKLTATFPPGFGVIGGQNHPYHHALTADSSPDSNAAGVASILLYQGLGTGCISEFYALAGTSWLLRWSQWDAHGPLVETGAPGPCQSEDAAFCAKVREAGYKVGAIWPHVVYDCGITQTGGGLSPGAEAKKRVEGVIYE